MKNKKIVYVLLLAVIIVWGTIILRVVGNKIEHRTQPTSRVIKNNFYELTKNYRYNLQINDPFLHKDYRINSYKHAPVKLINKKKEIVPIVTENKFDASFIIYNGLIQNLSNNIKIAIVSIENKKHYLQEGQELNGIKFSTFSNDSILVSKNGIQIFVRKFNKNKL